MRRPQDVLPPALKRGHRADWNGEKAQQSPIFFDQLGLAKEHAGDGEYREPIDGLVEEQLRRSAGRTRNYCRENLHQDKAAQEYPE